MPLANYPASYAELIDDSKKYKPGTRRALRAFARSKPWRGTIAERKAKFRRLHKALCAVYGKRTRLVFGSVERGEFSGASCYSPGLDRIRLEGKLSVVTYLHEFAHALYGSCERRAVRWSINLYKQHFPRSFARAGSNGHAVIL